MDTNLIQFGLTAFVMLIVVVNPIAVAPVFVAVTHGMDTRERRGVLNRAVMASFGVALFFLLAGRAVLAYLGVTIYAFSISGGILLFTLAFPMLFGERSNLQNPARDEHRLANEDVAIFPMTIPQLAGPGTIATVLVLAAQAGNDLTRVGILTLIIVFVYAVTWPTLYTAERIMARLGEAQVHVITRVLGLVLAALAVQYVLNGIAGFYSTLTVR